MAMNSDVSITRAPSENFQLNSELVLLLASIALSLFVFAITRSWRKHQNRKFGEYLNESDVSRCDVEKEVTSQRFLDSSDDEDEIFNAMNARTEKSADDDGRFTI
ncbi:hypothetical protein HA402_003243 [Bradysia odoriphaga]|nr:hypothetical protein HA402_003243 [Bradysia odoriphaga]